MDLDPALCRQAMLARDARFDGRFFIGVASTGIYCRPICPARLPRAEHCTFFRTAAAAQAAGFRPCLRCRPETAPGFGAWLGTSATVSRALALIEDGGFEGADHLASRLGLGARQVRRLFERHVGTSPAAVAQTRRVLLAKQLVHETDLSMTAIAHAAGYGSVRRFNEAFRTMFGRPPAALRRRPHVGANDTAEITLSLGYRPPYDWSAILSFLAARAIPGVEIVAGGVYRRTIRAGEAYGTIMVAHEPARHRLRATIACPSVAALPSVIARLRRVFDLDADPAVIGAALSADPRLAPLVAERPGLRVPGAWDGFELGVRAIAGQQVTVAAATRLVGLIAARFGAPIKACDGAPLTHVFPTPQALSSAVLGGMPMARAEAIVGLAVAAAHHPELFARGADLSDSVARLCRLRGIGEWTAHYIAMRAMREPDAFPAADIGLMRAMDDGAGRPSAKALLARAEAWRPWRAYAAMHLWNAPPRAVVSSIAA